MLPALIGAKDAAKKAIEALAAGERRLGIVGAEGSGKSAVLGAIADDLHARGEAVHRLAVTRGDDAAFAAMVALAGELDPDDKTVFPVVRDDRKRFSEKLRGLAAELESKKATLLVDDPPLRRLDLTATIFDDRLAELSECLLQLRDVRVVVSGWQRFPGPSVTIHPRFDPTSVLASMTDVAFRNAAADLQKGPRLAEYSPVEMRLVVAAVAKQRPTSEFTARRWDPSDLLAVVLDGEPELRHLVGVLALERKPFDGDLLKALDANSLSSRRRALLDEVLLLHTPEGYVLHGLIGRRARGDEWLSPSDRVDAHRTLSSWHRSRFDSCKGASHLAGAFAHEIELVHHLTEAGDVDAVFGCSVYFSEQYDALGKALSLADRYPDAVRAYERAITFDDPPDRIDAYAHHYLAYNLDVQATDPDRVRSEYTRAREAQPTHPWFWSRLICFMVTTGHLDEAMNLWSEAAASFQLDRGEEWIALELHRNVAHLLTHRGQIDFARRVLRDVPRAGRTMDWYVALDGWLSELEAAERDQLVFPPSIRPDERWDGPHLLRNPSDRDRVLEWQAGRISWTDDDGVRIRVGRLGPDGNPVYSYVDYSHEAFANLTAYRKYGLQLPAGTFVEILRMKDDSGTPSEQILSWPRQLRRLPGLPPIFPVPDRYIRRALARG